MNILVNDTPLALGAAPDPEALHRAGLRPPGLLRRLLGGRGRGRRLDSPNCRVEIFDGDFHLYPCTEGYLNRDRQWRTNASVFLERGRVRSVLLRVIEGRYAAVEFADRFRDVCNERVGDGHAVDRYTRRWKNGQTTFLSCLQPDGKNVCFIIETLD